jgi:hypothetical protein
MTTWSVFCAVMIAVKMLGMVNMTLVTVVRNMVASVRIITAEAEISRTQTRSNTA